MASTIKHSLTDTEWTQVVTTEDSVAVQPGGKTNLAIFIGDTSPDEDSPGLIIGEDTPNLPRTFSASGLAGAGVWLKATEGNTTAVVVAI